MECEHLQGIHSILQNLHEGLVYIFGLSYDIFSEKGARTFHLHILRNYSFNAHNQLNLSLSSFFSSHPTINKNYHEYKQQKLEQC